MKQWIVAHIDALIPLVLGLYMGVKAFFLPKSVSSSLDSAKKRQILRVAGAGLVALGIFRFLGDSMAGEGQPRSMIGYEPSPRDPANFRPVDPAEFQKPVIVATDDGMASAEFPQAPIRTEAVDDAPGVKVHRVTKACNFQGVDLRLGFIEYAPGSKEAPRETLLAGIKDYFKQNGFELVGSSEFPGSIHELVMNKPDMEVRQVMRIWFGPEGIYRAIATTEKGHHEDPRALALISSFRRTESGLKE